LEKNAPGAPAAGRLLEKLPAGRRRSQRSRPTASQAREATQLLGPSLRLN